MANPRKLDKRRKSIRNIRKITRTMELIATARFKKAMDRATAATSYTNRITQLVADLSQAGASVQHPLLEERDSTENATLLVLTANRGLCGGFNGNVIRKALQRRTELMEEYDVLRLEISGKRGVSGFNFRGIKPDEAFLQFDDQPKFAEVQAIADRYLDEYMLGKLDRLDVIYMKFISASKQVPVLETLLPLGSLEGAETSEEDQTAAGGESMYEFMPSAESILEEVVPTSFRVKLFKCFLDGAVSEQIARMIAMKSATDNANQMIKSLSMAYNRARQGQITTEIMDIIGGVEALNK
jgi:F-type H+-transporting ATPase subunit gamma